jgi:hypothetical protein
VQIFEPAQLSVSFTTTPVTCYGGIDGEISLTVNGGTGPYFYNWTPPSGAPAIPSTPIVSGLTSNIYFVEVSDVNGCSTDPNITTINVPGPQNNLAININVIDALCFGNNDGQAQAFPTGGTPPYSYEWSDGQTSLRATSLSSGDISLPPILACITEPTGVSPAMAPTRRWVADARSGSWLAANVRPLTLVFLVIAYVAGWYMGYPLDDITGLLTIVIGGYFRTPSRLLVIQNSPR